MAPGVSTGMASGVSFGREAGSGCVSAGMLGDVDEVPELGVAEAAVVAVAGVDAAEVGVDVGVASASVGMGGAGIWLRMLSR